jgi:GNAT superfamily N-acetyltransferase
MSQLETGYDFRAANSQDIENLLEIFNVYWETLTGVVKFTIDDFNSILSAPGFDLGSSTLLITGVDGDIVGTGLVIDLNSPPVHPIFYGCVQKGYEGRGIGSHLLAWGEGRARQAIKRCPDDARVSMYVQASQSHKPTINLLNRAGLTPIRYSWFMMRELADRVTQPAWPDGLKLTTYQEYCDLEAILNAADEAFEDHWGHVDRSGDPERIERFRHSIESDPDFDPSIWYLVLDGDEIAGVALCNPRLGPDRETGIVDVLGVRRHWRRKGLGLALLNHTFAEFLQRGYKRVGLGVDSQNLSGATRLYKKAGMEITSELVMYEKELRSGEELGRQG